MVISEIIDAWDLGDVTVAASADREDWHRVEAQGRQYILKIYREAHRDLEHIGQGLEMQSYVATSGLATSELVSTHTGQTFWRTPDMIASMEVALSPRSDGVSESDWCELGRTVAQLHSLPVPAHIKPSRLEPQTATARSIDSIERNAGGLSRSSRAVVGALIDRVSRGNPTNGCYRVLIHSDLCWANIVRTNARGLALIDFEGGGSGPAVMDLPEITTQLCTGPSGSGPLNVPAAIAFFGTYCDCRTVEDMDADLLAYSHAIHELYFLADALSRGDHSFVARMDRRLQTWNDGVLEELGAIMRSSR